MYNGNIKTFVVDSDVRRRAQIAFELNRLGVSVAPFDTVAEMRRYWPEQGFVLIEDRDDALDQLREAMEQGAAWLPFVAYSDTPDTDAVVRAMNRGAIGYVGQPFEVSRLCAAIEGAITNSADAIERHRSRTRARALVKSLTEREREVLAWLGEGLSNRRIGSRLGISARTVEVHRANLMTKLGVRGLGQAVRLNLEAALA